MTSTLTETNQTPLSLFVIPENKDQPMIPLVPGAELPDQAESVLNIGWCMTIEQVKVFKDKGVDVYVLLVTSQDDSEKSRQLVPLSAGGSYVRFVGPGINRLHATVVWNGDDHPRSILLSRDDYGDYNTNVLDQIQPGVEQLQLQLKKLHEELEGAASSEKLGEIEVARLLRLSHEKDDEIKQARDTEPLQTVLRRYESLGQLDYEFVHAFDVPREMFGDNSPLIKWLGTFYRWKTKAREQCDVRKRALITAPTIPLFSLFIVVKWLIMAVSFIVGLGFLGLRRPNPNALLHPRSNFIDDLFAINTTSFWFTTRGGNEREDPLLAANPVMTSISFLLVGVISFIVMMVKYWGDHPNPGRHWVALWHHWWMYAIAAALPSAIYIVVIAGFAVAALVGAVAGTSAASDLLGKFEAWRKSRRQVRAQKEEQKKREALNKLDLVACSSGPTKPAPVAAVQRQNTPTVMSYEKLKAKLCRPLPR